METRVEFMPSGDLLYHGWCIEDEDGNRLRNVATGEWRFLSLEEAEQVLKLIKERGMPGEIRECAFVIEEG